MEYAFIHGEVKGSGASVEFKGNGLDLLDLTIKALHKNEQCRHTFEITHKRCAPCSGYDTNCERYEKTKGAADTKTSKV